MEQASGNSWGWMIAFYSISLSTGSLLFCRQCSTSHFEVFLKCGLFFHGNCLRLSFSATFLSLQVAERFLCIEESILILSQLSQSAILEFFKVCRDHHIIQIYFFSKYFFCVRLCAQYQTHCYMEPKHPFLQKIETRCPQKKGKAPAVLGASSSAVKWHWVTHLDNPNWQHSPPLKEGGWFSPTTLPPKLNWRTNYYPHSNFKGNASWWKIILCCLRVLVSVSTSS